MVGDMSLKGNLRRLRKVVKLTQDQLAEKAGVPQSLISDLETGKRETTSFLPELAAALNCSVKDLDPRYREPVVSSFDPDASGDPHDSEAQPSISGFPPDAIKELAAKAGMGAGELAVSVNNLKSEGDYQRDSFTDDYWRLPASFVRDSLSSRVADLLVITCKGDSMEPTLSAGDRVIANTFERTPTVDGIYAILNGVEEVVVKRLAIVGRDPPRLKVISDNPSTPPEEYALDQVPIVGRVVAGLKLF